MFSGTCTKSPLRYLRFFLTSTHIVRSSRTTGELLTCHTLSNVSLTTRYTAICTERTSTRSTSHGESGMGLSLIHISEPTRQAEISYAVFCLKKKKEKMKP